MQHISTLSNVKVEKKQLVERLRLLSLYLDPPQYELTLDEFEVISLARLQLLRAIEALKTKGGVEGETSFNNQVYEVTINCDVPAAQSALSPFTPLRSWKRSTCTATMSFPIASTKSSVIKSVILFCAWRTVVRKSCADGKLHS